MACVGDSGLRVESALQAAKRRWRAAHPRARRTCAPPSCSPSCSCATQDGQGNTKGMRHVMDPSPEGLLSNIHLEDYWRVGEKGEAVGLEAPLPIDGRPESTAPPRRSPTLAGGRLTRRRRLGFSCHHTTSRLPSLVAAEEGM